MNNIFPHSAWFVCFRPRFLWSRHRRWLSNWIATSLIWNLSEPICHTACNPSQWNAVLSFKIFCCL